MFSLYIFTYDSALNYSHATDWYLHIIINDLELKQNIV